MNDNTLNIQFNEMHLLLKVIKNYQLKSREIIKINDGNWADNDLCFGFESYKSEDAEISLRFIITLDDYRNSIAACDQVIRDLFTSFEGKRKLCRVLSNPISEEDYQILELIG